MSTDNNMSALAPGEKPGIYREQWLTMAVDELRPIFKNAGYTIPPVVHVSVGWPSSGGIGRKKQTIGQAWAPEVSADKRAHVFVSPVLGKSVETLDVLVHELGHVVVGNKHGHRGPFVTWMHRLGMEGKPTEAGCGPELKAELERIVESIGEYPHAKLAPEPRKVQGTRLLKVACPDCGYTIRVTRKWLDEGTPTCPCGELMLEDAELGDDTLNTSSAVHEYVAHDGRFGVVYIKRMRGERITEQRWLVTDWEVETDGKPGRVTELAARNDVLAFIEAVIAGVYKYDDSTRHIIDAPANIDGDDDDYLDPDELEEPDDAETAEPDPDYDDAYPAPDDDEPVEVLPTNS